MQRLEPQGAYLLSVTFYLCSLPEYASLSDHCLWHLDHVNPAVLVFFCGQMLSIPSVNSRFQQGRSLVIDKLLGGAMVLLGIKVLLGKTADQATTQDIFFLLGLDRLRNDILPSENMPGKQS